MQIKPPASEYQSYKICKQFYSIYYYNNSTNNIDYFHSFRIKSTAEHGYCQSQPCKPQA